ncbi:hypothetical protein EYF80_054996 [Liparis tanakae]|uniref:Uncharacterized protein n=1 Tax=Liparis tanakae TaxID=230148 RepID=A0A4Z2F0V4_9TELE|nr:hypothetical protein EYF80_054996 [Liparis tanakae]
MADEPAAASSCSGSTKEEEEFPLDKRTTVRRRRGDSRPNIFLSIIWATRSGSDPPDREYARLRALQQETDPPHVTGQRSRIHHEHMYIYLQVVSTNPAQLVLMERRHFPRLFRSLVGSRLTLTRLQTTVISV